MLGGMLMIVLIRFLGAYMTKLTKPMKPVNDQINLKDSFDTMVLIKLWRQIWAQVGGSPH
jgi:hypothetical protein